MRYAPCVVTCGLVIVGMGLARAGQQKDAPAAPARKDAPVERSTYNDAVYGFSLEAPRFPAAGPNQAVVPIALTSVAEGGFSSNVNTMVQMITTTREDFRALSLKEMQRLGWKVNSDKDVTVCGRDAIEIDYAGQMRNKDLHFLSISVIEAKRVIVVTCAATAEDFKTLEPEFRACLASFKLK